MKIHKNNVHKLIDVVLPQTFINKLAFIYTYQDQVLKEHLYNIDTVEESCAELHIILTKEEQSLLKEVRVACDEHGAAYFRPIFP